MRVFPALADDVEDIVQTVFMRICEGKCRCHGKERLRGYLCGTAVNVARSHLRAQRRRMEAACGAVSAREGGVRDPLDVLLTDEAMANVRREVARLPHKSREAVEDVYFEDCESAVQARVRDRARRDVHRTRLEYALSRLRVHLLTQKV